MTGPGWGDEHFAHSIVAEVADRCLDLVWAGIRISFLRIGFRTRGIQATKPLGLQLAPVRGDSLGCLLISRKNGPQCP